MGCGCFDVGLPLAVLDGIFGFWATAVLAITNAPFADEIPRAVAFRRRDELPEAESFCALAFAIGDEVTIEHSLSVILARTKFTMTSSANGKPPPKRTLVP